MKIRLSMNKEIQLQTKSDGNTVTRFTLEEIDLEDKPTLKEVFRNYVHATNVWAKDQKCGKDSYQGMVGLAFDADDGLITMPAAGALFKEYKYILYTSTGHLEDKPNHYGEQHRFRIILPFEPSDSLYFTNPDEADKVYAWAKWRFPQFDPYVFARHMKLFPNRNPNPDHYIVKVNTEGDWFRVPIEEVYQLVKDQATKTSTESAGSSDKYRYIKHGMDIVLPNKRISYKLETLRPYLATCKDQKQPCYCPFCDDLNSESASAFVQMSTEGFVHLFCSHCKSVADQKGEGQYYYFEDPVEPGMFMLEDKLLRVHMTASNAHVVKVREDYISKGNRDYVKTYLSRMRNIPSAKFTVDRFASAAYDQVQYELDFDKSCLQIQIPTGINVQKKDNAFIDSWLDSVFGKYTDFIKNWLALYCYTNYQKLPVIVLTGPRATGKTTFSEIVASIFPDLATDWDGNKQDFTPFYTNKLLMVEENYVNRKEQYVQIKKVTGSEFLTVNEKYMPQYRVRNNTNIILTTNEPRPVFLAANEKPTSPDDNNFFIYKVPAIKKLNPIIKEEIRERFGHYLQTELLSRYKKWEAQQQSSTARYGIPCPITDLEKDLYDSAQTNIEAETELVAEALVLGYPDNDCKTLGGGSHIMKMEFREMLKAMRLRPERHQDYFRRLQDSGVVAYQETRNASKRLGFEILRKKHFYGEAKTKKPMTGMTEDDSVI
ncbi:hypothetical protein BMS3Bbin04_01428 [bacterium BMS3Bbin04]|nr:hypothetical protein BMS3Bbin04_01428 [bacterium BMS3Bbin04]